jgi:hypothetical protein
MTHCIFYILIYCKTAHLKCIWAHKIKLRRFPMLTQKPRVHCFNILHPNDVNRADVGIKSSEIVMTAAHKLQYPNHKAASTIDQIVDGARIRWCKYTTAYRSIVAIQPCTQPPLTLLPHIAAPPRPPPPIC